MADESAEELESALERVVGMGASDLTQRALAGQLARAYAREAEVAKVFESLAARRSVLLLGPADVGKTAILHEAVARIARKQAPAALAGKRVVAISTGAVMVGTKYLGEWQTRLGELLDAIKQAKDIILCFEDIWALRDAGRASDKADGFSNFLRPYLERGEMVVIGECTPETFAGSEYGARALADDPSLMKHFTVVQVEEPDRDVTKGILVAVARDLQRAHHVRVEPAAIERALELTRRFLPYAAFPGKAKRLLDEAAQLRAPGGAGEKDDGSGRKAPAPAGDPLVDADTVTAAFSRMTGLPEKIISDAIPISQEEMRTYFDERVVGQEEAVAAVVDVVTLVKAELNDPGRPLGVLFFVGPTGVGKTELAKTLAEYLFGSKEKLIRLDMSEFKTAFGTADLLRQITEKQRRQHFSVLLLDEFEKANPYVFDLFLQAFDDARISDSSGRTVDLRNTIIVMTSNIGTELSEARGIGFLEASGGQERAQERARQVARAVEEYFRPEFINRLDKIVVFQPLGRAEMRRIARRELGRALMREGVLRRNILLDFREEVLDALLAAGFSPTYGARPLQRAIKDLVLLPLARRIAAQPATGEQLLELCVVDGRIDAAIIPVTAATQPEPSTPPEGDDHGQIAGGVEAMARRASLADLRQLQGVVAALRERIEANIASERFAALQERTRALLEQSTTPSFWDDNERARRIFSTIYHQERVTDRVVSLRGRADDLTQVAEMIRRHGDTAGIARLAASLEQLEQDVTLAELELFAGDADAVATDAVFIRVTPVEMLRAREAGDWPARLAEMYARWAGRKGHEVAALHAEGDDPLLLVRGPNLAAILRGEEGIHKLQEGEEEPRRRVRPAPRVRLARVEVLAVPPDGAVRFDGALDPAARDDVGRDGARAGDGRGPRMVEVRDEAAGIQIRLRASKGDKGEMGDQAARDLLAALLVRGRADQPPSDEVVRVYHLMKTSYVRDPRTGARSSRPREVLDGALDAFLLAYLTQAGMPERAAASVAATVTLPRGEG